MRFRRRFRGGGGISASNGRVAIVVGTGGELGRVTAEKLAAELLAHAVAPGAIADILYLASDAAAPVSGAVVPAYGT